MKTLMALAVSESDFSLIMRALLEAAKVDRKYWEQYRDISEQLALQAKQHAEGGWFA